MIVVIEVVSRLIEETQLFLQTSILLAEALHKLNIQQHCFMKRL